ncbi:hypothetical protein [Staphylococcus haemolyticus]|uniref:hypothetical protein n=1 Tax=Staphylococcus haemolyticus TaxID=1283 RepID=UPI0015D706A6|nr:hypothetical protein [Staphylococcus haemolyticus]
MESLTCCDVFTLGVPGPVCDGLVFAEGRVGVVVGARVDVFGLVESLSVVDVDPLNAVLALVESLTLVDVDPLNDVLILVESLTLVDVDALNDLLQLVENITQVDRVGLTCVLHLVADHIQDDGEVKHVWCGSDV